MSIKPRLTLHHTTDREPIYPVLESWTVPRVGEEIAIGSKWWRVIDVWYRYPMPGSTDYNLGNREPTVELGVEAVNFG